MASLHPLILQPVFKKRIWGGRSLETFFGPAMPEGPIGEAWVLGEHEQGTNVVTNGIFAGASLTQLRRDFGSDLLGTRGTSSPSGRCPLLIKLLDAREELSVQVHPPDGFQHLPPGESGKTEMWYVLAAEPHAEIVYGLRDGVDKAVLAAGVRSNSVEMYLRRLPVSKGDVFLVPAGTIHALGKGMIVAEVQQSSDITYRLYDYNRPGLDGKLRQLHQDQALEVMRYDTPDGPIRNQPIKPKEWQTLVSSRYFVVHKGQVNSPWLQQTAPTSFDALLVYEGHGEIAWDNGREELQGGQAVLVPACLGRYELSGHLNVLRARLP